MCCILSLAAAAAVWTHRCHAGGFEQQQQQKKFKLNRLDVSFFFFFAAASLVAAEDPNIMEWLVPTHPLGVGPLQLLLPPPPGRWDRVNGVLLPRRIIWFYNGVYIGMSGSGATLWWMISFLYCV